MAEYTPPAGFLGPELVGDRRASYLSEMLTNAAGNPLLAGEVVRISANLTVTRAQADTVAHATGVVGVTRTAISTGARGGVVNQGLGFTLLEAALAPAAGNLLWLSATAPGRATNVMPAAPLPAVYLGVIKDALPYATTGGVIADLAPTFPASAVTTLHNAYAYGNVAVDQTLILQDARGGSVVIDGSQPGFTGTYALQVLGQAYVSQRLGIGIATPTIGVVHAVGGSIFTNIPAQTAAIGYIQSTVGWTGSGFLFGANAGNDSFSMVIGLDSAAYFGRLTNVSLDIELRLMSDRANFPENVVLDAFNVLHGAGAQKCLVLSNASTGPTASADLCHLYCKDNGAGHATLAIYCEEVVAAVTTETLSEYLPVFINGVLKKLALIA